LKPKVFVTRNIPKVGLELLEAKCQVSLWSDEFPPSKDKIIEGIKGKDAVLCMLSDKIDVEVMDAVPSLKVITTFSVGYDHISIPEATKRGIYVTYTPGVLTDATADFAWTLILASARRIVEYDKFVREGKWKIGWSPTFMLGRDVYGKTIGIVGLGRIGSAVAKRAKGFGMKILYHNTKPSPEQERTLGAEYRSLEGLLKESDIVSLHVPLNDSTRNIIGEKQLKLMKPTAFLINTSRGAIIDEAALFKALQEKWIGGAALDVFPKEPIDVNNPLLKLDNIVLTPHMASAGFETRYKMAEITANDLLAVLSGKAPLYLVNPDVQKVRPLSKVKVL